MKTDVWWLGEAEFLKLKFVRVTRHAISVVVVPPSAWPYIENQLGRVKRIWYLSPMWAAKVQASLSIRTVSPEPPRLAHTGSESRGTFSQKARSLAPLNGWACAVKICHDGMLEDINSLDAAQLSILQSVCLCICQHRHSSQSRSHYLQTVRATVFE